MINGRRMHGCMVALSLVVCFWPGASYGEMPPARFPLPSLVLVAPGTIVGEKAPKGWSHLVIKSVPHLESGDLDSLPSFAGSTATLFRTVILADVRSMPGPTPHYRLARVGLGLCMPSGHDDTVVTRESVASSRASLGLIERKVLELAEEELKKARLIARSEQFAVLASPSELLVEGEHDQVHLFYALLVDPEDGRLNVLFWASTVGRGRGGLPSPLERLPADLMFRCGLDVKAERLFGALPVNWSFAMSALPPGDPIPAPEGLTPWLSDARRIAAEPRRFEVMLRPLVHRSLHPARSEPISTTK